ncbi:hypothetical protein CHUAL_012051 [Chamberlinius hualienensis]
MAFTPYVFKMAAPTVWWLGYDGSGLIVCIKCLVYYTPQGEHQHSLWAKFYGLMWGKMMWLILKIPTINRISRRFFVHFNSNSSSTQMNARFRRSVRKLLKGLTVGV